METRSLNLNSSLNQFQDMMDSLLQLEAAPQTSGNMDHLGMQLDGMRQQLEELCGGIEEGSRPQALLHAQAQRCQVLQDVLKFDQRDELGYQAVHGVMRGLRLCGMLPNSGETFADWVERAIAFYHQGSELVNLGCVTMTQVVGIGTFAQVKQDSSGSVVYKCFDSEQLKRGIEQDGTIFQPAGFLASGFWNDLALTPYILDFGVRILDDICDYYLKMPRLKKSILADRSRMKVASIEEKENLARQVVTLAADECRRGVVHGDIKRNNIMEDSSGSLRLIDYSLARRFSDPEKMRLRYWENQMSPRLPDNPKLDVEFCAATLVDVFMALERNDLLFSVIYALKRPERDSEFSLIPPRLRPVLRDALSSFFIPNAAAFEAAVNQALSVG